MISPPERVETPGIGEGELLARTLADAQGRDTPLGDARHAFLALLVGSVVWEIAGQTLHYSFLPPLSDVLRGALRLIASGQILGYLAASLVSLLVGYGLASSAGVALGLLMGRYRLVEYLIEPYVGAFLTAPKLIFIPILYAFLGIGRGTQVAVVFLSAFFVIVINTMAGIRSVDVSWIEMARAFGAKEGQLFWKVLLPGALPLMMAGLRLGMGRAVKGMIRGEMFIALFGMGALLRKYGSRFDSESVFAILLVVVALALICSFAVEVIERRLTGWTEP
jgi:ABC-type nitrate/sulfonate/bicarbonate transport system permease component